MSSSIPRLVPYHKLAQFMASIDTGYLGSVRETFCEDLEDEEKVDGAFRDIVQFLPLLASFYMKIEQQTGEKLLWFDKENTFKVILGGDGAPFGKYDTSCSWLVSFLNRGRHVLSSDENFLIFGANCGEESLPVRRYVQKLVSDIAIVERSVYIVDNSEIRFEFAELPNDLKMLAFLAGELPVSAKYFSTFGSVNTDDYTDIKGTYGSKMENKWKPWKYGDRLKFAKAVKAQKGKLEKQKIAESTKRSKLTSFIAQQKHRQEFEPLIGPLIDRAHIDTLHCKNNACQQIFKQLLTEAVGKSKLPENISKFSSVPSSCTFAKFVGCLKAKARMGRLAKNIVRWFNESKASGKSFEYRFTGQDSRLLMHHFMFIIEALEQENDSEMQTFHLHLLAFVLLELRESTALFCRVRTDELQIEQLQIHCSNVYRAMVIFRSITPTLWNIGHVIPSHALDVYNKYALGLGVLSMEGREAKHQAIANYNRNTQYKHRWQQIFQHEFIQLIWLRERGYFVEDNNTYKGKYVPDRTKEAGYCFCGLDKESNNKHCRYCSHHFRSQIIASVKAGKNCTNIFNRGAKKF